MKTALAIRHVDFEHLGTFEPVLESAGYSIEYLDAGFGLPQNRDWLSPDLLVLLGGPIGAYEEREYPFLNVELKAAAARFEAEKPVLGICLGSQVMARALGSRAYPGPQKEIGWKPLRLTPAGEKSAVRHLAGASMFHWHGDTFDLPTGATLLASTDACANQIYAWGNSLAFQCHPEIRASEIDRWLIGHAAELSAEKINAAELRNDTAAQAGDLAGAGARMLREWLIR